MSFRVASIFSDNMVLQRDKRVAVFGEAEDGTVITVSFLEQEVSTTAEGGRFKLWLPPMDATKYDKDRQMVPVIIPAAILM